MLANSETALYRYWDKESQLLYIGVSFNALSRAGQHKSSSLWYKLVARIEIEWFPTRGPQNRLSVRLMSGPGNID